VLRIQIDKHPSSALSPPTMSSSTSSSSLAANAAHTSMKRSRNLFDVNPTAAFLPSVDPLIQQAAMERRKRRPQHASLQKHDKITNALTVVNPDQQRYQDSTIPMAKPVQNALAVRGDGTTEESTKPTGILVVRRFIMRLLFLVS
jgi:hypothetical protein